MCGIVGYIGPKEACPILINGLKRLEYRGYDSAGIALIHNNNIQVTSAREGCKTWNITWNWKTPAQRSVWDILAGLPTGNQMTRTLTPILL
mgnify:CR=1 FL=1